MTCGSLGQEALHDLERYGLGVMAGGLNKYIVSRATFCIE